MATIDYEQGQNHGFTGTDTFFCDFCPHKFETRIEKNTHILEHFTRKLCTICKKIVLQIGDDLYVLHSSMTCIHEETICDDNTTVANEFMSISQECDIDESNIVKSEVIHAEEFQIQLERTAENNGIEKENPLKDSIDQNVNSRKRQPRRRKLPSEHTTLSMSDKMLKSNSSSKKTIKTYICKFEGCGEILSSNKWHRSYHKTKHSSKYFECDICKATFPTKSRIHAHILNVHDPKSKKFKCDVCGLSYLSASLLAHHHKLTHLKERNFMCSECGRTFRSKHLLQIHIYCHTGEKPYGCTFEGCTRRFRCKSQRIEHNRSHTGEKPFKCTEEGCDRQFAYAVDFRRHKFNSHGIFTKKFPCQICNEVFPENMLLKKHMKKHKIQP